MMGNSMSCCHRFRSSQNTTDSVMILLFSYTKQTQYQIDSPSILAFLTIDCNLDIPDIRFQSYIDILVDPFQ